MALWTAGTTHHHGTASSGTADRTIVLSRRGGGNARDDVDHSTQGEGSTTETRSSSSSSSSTNFSVGRCNCSCSKTLKRVVRSLKRTSMLNKLFYNSTSLVYLYIFFLFVILSSFLFSKTVAESQITSSREKPLTKFVSSYDRVSSTQINERVRAKGDEGLLFGDEKQSRVKRGVKKNLASAENKNASNDSRRGRESRGLTWGEFIAKSSETAAHHSYAPNEAALRYGHNIQTSDNSGPPEARNFHHATARVVPNSQHDSYGRTSQKLDVHARRLDLYGNGPTSEFKNPNVVTDSPPIDGEVLDKLAHYLLYGSEETKKTFEVGSREAEDRDSLRKTDHNQGSEVNTGYYANDNTDRKDNSETYSYEANSPSYKYSNPSKDSSYNWDHPLQNENTPVQTSTETIDMKKIFQDLADLIEILPDHFEELDELDETDLGAHDAKMSARVNTGHQSHKHRNVAQPYGHGLGQQSESSSSAAENKNSGKIEEVDGFIKHLFKDQAERDDSSIIRPPAMPMQKFGSQTRPGTKGFLYPALKTSNSVSTTTPGSLQYVKDLRKFFRTSSLSPISGDVDQVSPTTKSAFYKPFEHRASSPKPPTTQRPSYERFGSTIEYQLTTPPNMENSQNNLQTTARPSIYSSIENIREFFRTSNNRLTQSSYGSWTESPSQLQTEKPILESFSSAQPPYRRDSSNTVSREPAAHDDEKPLIFTSRPIFTSNFMNEEGASVPPKSQLPHSWTTESSFSSIEAATQQTSMERVLLNSPHLPLMANSKNFNSSLDNEQRNSTDDEDQKKAQKRTLDLLYHMFVDPTTDENGNRRNTLLEDVIKAIDNHIIGDVVALKEYSQSGKKGQSHFKENNGDFFKTLLESIGFDEPFMKSTVDAFSSVPSSTSGRDSNVSRRPTSTRKPSGTRRNVSSSSKDATPSTRQASPQVQNSEPIPSGSNTHESSVRVVGEPHVETLPSGDEFLLTDEFGEQQLVTIEDIVSSLTALDDAELSELLVANRRSDQDVERTIARESTENQAVSSFPNAGFKINNLIVVGHDGKSEAIPFDQIGFSSQETVVSTTPAPIMVAAQHLLGNRVSDENVEANPTVQAAQHLLGFGAGSKDTLKHSYEYSYEKPLEKAPRPIYTKAHLRGKVLVTIPSSTAAAENPMLAINHNSNLQEYDQLRGHDSAFRNHGISEAVDSSAHALEAGVQRAPDDGFSGAQHEFMNTQMQPQQFDPSYQQGALQNSKYSPPLEIISPGQGAIDGLPSQLEAKEELQLKQKLALDLKLRTQLEQLQRIQNHLAALDESQLETITEASATAKPVDSLMLPPERIVDISPDHLNLQPEPARKVAVTSVPLQQTIGESGINNMLKDKEFISSSNEMNKILLKALSQLPSSEAGDRRVEASTFRTPTPLISDPQTVNENSHAPLIKPKHQIHRNDYRPHITVVENEKNLANNYDQHFPHANANQYALQLGLNPKFHATNVRQPSPSLSSLSLPHNLQFEQIPGLSKAHLNSHAQSQAPDIANSNSGLSYSYEDRHSPDLHYEPPYQNVRNDDYLDLSSYGNNEFRKQIIEKQNEEKSREKFASKIYEQVVKSLPRPIHFETTTTDSPITERPQIFGFNIPNIFPLPHPHSPHEEPVEKKSDDEKDELKWNDPLGLLGLYDYLPFSRKRKEEKKSVVKVTTPKPVSPEKRLQQALEIGNVPPHVSKLLVSQLKSKSDGIGSSEFLRPADRRQFDRVPQVRYRNIPNSGAYSKSPQVFHPRRNIQPQRRIPASSRSYPSPQIRARKFGPPNPSSLVPGSVVKGSGGAQLHGPSGYASTRPQSSHFGVFSSEKGYGGVSEYEHVHGDSHATEYSSADADHHSTSYDEDEDHGYHHSAEYDTYLVPLGTKGHKEVQPLFDLSLLLHNVKVEQVGEANESFSFPKIGDPSKFVNIYRPPPHYRR